MKAWPTPGLFPIIAHQGGWDEILMVVGPLLVVGGALWVANRRVASQLADGAGPKPDTPADQRSGASPSASTDS